MTIVERLEQAARKGLEVALFTQVNREVVRKGLSRGRTDGGKGIDLATIDGIIQKRIDAAMHGMRRNIQLSAARLDADFSQVRSRIEELEMLFAGKLSGSEPGLRDSTRKYLSQLATIRAQAEDLQTRFNGLKGQIETFARSARQRSNPERL